MVKYDGLADLEVGRQEEAIQLNEFQKRVMLVPEDTSVFLGGGRGGGKSFCTALLLVRHIVKYGDKARCWYIRQSHSGCEDFIQICRELFGRVWGPAVRFNSQSGIWTGFPGGGQLVIDQVSTYAEYNKWQGKSATCIAIDEAGQFPTDELINLLRSNLRGPLGMPLRMILSSNPAGVGHSFLYRKHVLKAVPWHPYEVDGETWVTCPSTLEGNIFIDREKYRRDLQAACSHDKELARAFIDGDWDVVRGGAFFAGCLDEKRVMFPAWKLPEGVTARALLKPKARDGDVGNGIKLAAPDLEPWKFYLSMDWGFSAPCVVFLCGRSPGAEVEGRYYPRGSILLLDCVDTARGEQLHVGSEMPVAEVALLVKRMCKRWCVAPQGVADDAAGIRNQDGVSVVDSFAENGVYFREAGKGSRIGGWQYMRELLNHAGSLDRAGLYASDSCRGFWQTVPFLPRSTRNPEDCEGGLIDHWADAARYACIRKSLGVTQREF